MSDNLPPENDSKDVPVFDTQSIPLPSGEGGSSNIQTPTAPQKITTSQKGVENAKKRLRAFSIQKKTPILPKALAKSSISGTTVVIGKLSSTKVTPKVQDPDAEVRRLPKPPKPGDKRNFLNESYTDLQKKTLAEIEDMKRKMELVELGIPLGLICPPPNSDTAMPSKAMPPIKTFLANYRDNILNKAKVNANPYTRKSISYSSRHKPAKVDELISEAKKARAEGRKFKFDYETILPDYDNPFQRKKEEEKPDTKKFDMYMSRSHHSWSYADKHIDKDRKRRDKSHESKRTSVHKKEYRDKAPKENESRDSDKSKHRVKEKGTSERRDEKKTNDRDAIETNVNLSDYLVCDSWSLDTEEKTSSPKPDEVTSKKEEVKSKSKDPMEIGSERLPGKKKIDAIDKSPIKKDCNQVDTIKKLQPVKDAFQYEIDADDDGDTLDIFDDSCDFSVYSKTKNTMKKKSSNKQSKNSTDMFDAHEVSNDNSQNSSIDEYSSKANNKFLEAVINEINKGDISDETSQDKKFLVEYELSPEKETPEKTEKPYHKARSITPELDDSYYDLCSSQRSDYSESTMRSIESGYKSTESGYKSNDSYRISESVTKEYADYQNDARMSKATVESLEMWSFVLKICQPLLFRHDSNTCYRNTTTMPKLWYTDNPKLCPCVKDRSVVYDELEACKMGLVDRVYGCDQIPETPCPKTRTWYPRINQCLLDNVSTLSTNWETDDSSQNSERMTSHQNPSSKLDIHRDEMALDREYKKFMEALLPEAADSKNNNDAEEMQSQIRKRITDHDKAEGETKIENKRKRKRSRKGSSDDWSQECDTKKEKSHKKMKEKEREKRMKKDSISSDSDSSLIQENVKKLKKSKRKDSKRKSKSEKKRRSDKKKHSHKKYKEKKKRRKAKGSEDHDFDSDSEEDLKKHKKNKEKKKTKKKEVKRKKKKQRKKKARTKSTSSSESDDDTSSETSNSSSTSSSITTSDSESEKENIRIRKRKQKKERRKIKRRHESESRRYSDEFDVNILKNIKKERLTDDEKSQKDMEDFSPRRQNTVVQRPEIINIKELHNDIVAHNLIHIKQEVVDEETELEELPKSVPPVSDETDITKSVEPEIGADDKEPTEKNVVPEDDSEHSQQPENIIQLQHIPIPEEIPLPTVDYKEPAAEVVSANDNDNYAQNDNVIYPQIQNYVEEPKFAADAVDEHAYEYEHCYSQYGNVDYEQENDVQMQDHEESRPIETLVSASGSRGEIKCDWRPEQRAPRAPPARPSRWGLKPNDSELNSSDGTSYDENRVYPIRSVLDAGAVEAQTFRIQTISTIRRGDNTASPVLGYDEAYEDTYGAADRLAYGDCFGSPAPPPATAPPPAPAPPPGPPPPTRTSRSLDARIDRALRETVLGLVTKEAIDEPTEDQSNRDKGILANKSGARAAKRVSFADGYAPGQDSDNEPPPKKKKKKTALRGCAWPCPATHPDHVPLWDALPPPDPPPGSPPPRAARRRAAPKLATLPLQPLKVA